MPTIESRSLAVSQQEYDNGYRVFYCTFCPNTVFGDVDVAEDMRCLSCLPVPQGPPPHTFEHRPMETAQYNAQSEEFVWNREVGGAAIVPAAPPVE